MSTNRRPLTSRSAPGHGARTRHEELARGLGWFSIGLGLLELTAAHGLCRALGMPGREMLVRTYGVREVATGVAILMSHDPTPWILGRVGGDALDLATLGAEFNDRNSQKTNLAVATAAVAGVTVIDIVCAQGLIDGKRLAQPGEFDHGDRSGFPKSPRSMLGAASDFEPPADFRIPEALRPWQEGRSSAPTAKV